VKNEYFLLFMNRFLTVENTSEGPQDTPSVFYASQLTTCFLRRKKQKKMVEEIGKIPLCPPQKILFPYRISSKTPKLPPERFFFFFCYRYLFFSEKMASYGKTYPKNLTPISQRADTFQVGGKTEFSFNYAFPR